MPQEDILLALNISSHPNEDTKAFIKEGFCFDFELEKSKG